MVSVSRSQEWSRNNRRHLTLGWLLLNVAWSAVRIAAVEFGLTNYGVPIIGYFFTELFSAFAWGFGSAHLTLTIITEEGRHKKWWLLVTMAGFLAPDIYILRFANHFPRWRLVAVLVIVPSLAAISLYDSAKN